LIACDFTKREAKILANTVTQQDFMLTYRNQEIAKRDEEIAKRDNLLKVKDELIELGYEREAEYVEQIKLKDRKLSFGKWKVGGGVTVGIAVGYGLYKLLN
jgi:uncharacterized protein (DUF3084 family)